MKDNYGDHIDVSTMTGNVWVEASAILSPKKARKLAAKILKAADGAEAYRDSRPS
jgi:hypothetical protein